MGQNTKYEGYESFDYLDATEDYEAFDLPAMHSGFEPYEVSLDEHELARAEKIAGEATIVSLHEHAFSFPEQIREETWEYVRQGRVFTPYEYLAESNLDGVFDMHLDGLSGIHSQEGWKWDDIVHDLGMRACDIAHQDFVVRAESVSDIRQAKNEGRLAMVPALESSAMIENELDRIEILYGLGVRSMGLTYNESNALGTGQDDIYERDGGLTAFGVEAIERMNDVGMAVSVSHASPQTALDACAVSDAPVLDTHTLAEEVGYGASDEELRAVADTGGVVAVASSAVIPDIEYFMENFEYMVDLVGIDHVAFGPDVLYGDHRGLLNLLDEQYDVTIPESARDCDHVEGLENPTEAWHNIVRWLVRERYDDEDIKKVLGENVLRVLEEIW